MGQECSRGPKRDASGAMILKKLKGKKGDHFLEVKSKQPALKALQSIAFGTSSR
jgi:positive regulator of sigma E activity